MSGYQRSTETTLDLVSVPEKRHGVDAILDLRLWAKNSEIGFATASPDFLFGGPQEGSNNPPGTYPKGKYDDAWYPGNAGLEPFDENLSAFEQAFTKWTAQTSYPWLHGKAYPPGTAFRVFQDKLTAASPKKIYSVSPSQIQWVWVYFFLGPNGKTDFEFLRATVSILDRTDVVLTQPTEKLTNPHFYRLTIRARQPVPKYALRIEFEMTGTADADDSVPFWIGGRLGFFDMPPI